MDEIFRYHDERQSLSKEQVMTSAKGWRKVKFRMRWRVRFTHTSEGMRRKREKSLIRMACPFWKINVYCSSVMWWWTSQTKSLPSGNIHSPGGERHMANRDILQQTKYCREALSSVKETREEDTDTTGMDGGRVERGLEEGRDILDNNWKRENEGTGVFQVKGQKIQMC